MPHGLFKRGSHSSGHKHRHSEKEADKVPYEEYAELQRELQDRIEELDDVAENLQLAKLSAKTLEDHFRSELDDANNLRSSFRASEARVSELESQAQTFLASEAQVSELESQSRAGRGDAAELSSALEEQRARVAELERQHVAAEEQHKAVVSKLAGEAMTKASDADDAKTRLTQLQQKLAEAQAEAAELRKSDSELASIKSELSERSALVASLRSELESAAEERSRSSGQKADDHAELESVKSKLADSSALAANLQLQLDAVAEERSRSSGRDDAQLAAVRSELAERNALVTRLQSQLQASAEGTPGSPGETAHDYVELANLKLELAARSDQVASLESRLDAAAEEGLRLVNANTDLEEQLQEATQKSIQLSERLDSSISATDGEAMRERAENAVERSVALLAEVAAFQAESESLRRELDEAASRPNLESLVEQATGRSAELLASLAASEAACDLLRGEAQAAQASRDAATSRAEVLATELSSAEGSAQEANAALRAELTEAQALGSSSVQTADELREELARECAGHKAATAAADSALAKHTALRSEVAEAQSAVESSETRASKLQTEVTQERAGRESEAHAAIAAQQLVQSERVHKDEVHALRHELSQERRQANAEVAALAAAREQLAAAPMPGSGGQDEIQELISQVSDLKYALNITSEAAACLDDSSEPVGIQEARRFRAECVQLQSELQRCRATSSAGSPSRDPRMTADFGDVGFGRVASLPGENTPNWLNRRDRSTPSFTSQATCKTSDADEKNPFSSAVNEEIEEPSTGDGPPAFSFIPPGRKSPQAAAAEGAGNPFGEDVLDDPDSTNPFQEPSGNQSAQYGGNPFDMQSSPGHPSPADDIVDVSRNDSEVLKPQTSSMSLPMGTTASTTPSFCSKDVAAAQAAAAAEVAHLRAALQSEERACEEAKAACAEAREEAARGAKRALAAASGADAGGEAGEVHELRRALSDEAAKSRRLCEQALRAEESRRRLLHEMLEDSQAEVDVVQLAQLVGRAAKAIAAVSEAAPLRPAEQVSMAAVATPMSMGRMPGTSTPAGSPPRTVPAPEASVSQPGSAPQAPATRTPQRLPCLPGLPAGSLSDVAVTPSRLRGIPGLPGPAAQHSPRGRSPRASMPTSSEDMDLR